MNIQIDVRKILREDGTYWFVAKDVFEALGLVWSGADSLEGIRDDWKGSTNLVHPFDPLSEIIISEPALYKLVFRSDTPQAQAFADHVANYLTQ